mgnify:CR=1 FL=1
MAYSITEFTGYFEFFRLYEYIVKLDIYEFWILFLFSLLGAIDDIYIDEVCINQQTNKTIFKIRSRLLRKWTLNAETLVMMQLIIKGWGCIFVYAGTALEKGSVAKHYFSITRCCSDFIQLRNASRTDRMPNSFVDRSVTYNITLELKAC